MSQIIQCQVTSGTYTPESSPALTHYGPGKTSLWVNNNTGSRFNSYFHIALPADLAGKRVISAHIVAKMDTIAGTPHLKIQRHAKPTPYASMTWNNRAAALAGSTAVTITHAGSTQTWDFDVTTELQAVADGGLYYGWVLTTTDITTNWHGSGWGTADAPYMTIEVDDLPLAPTGVTPNGITANNKPVLTWPAPDDIVSAQVQVTATTDPTFAAPAFDSGVQATAHGQLDLNALGYTGISPSGATKLMRVRQSNSHGTSDWSNTISVTYTPLGTLTVSSPASTTTDPTPTVGWSYTGTQARWQVQTYRSGVLIADTGVVAGTDVAYQPKVGATTSGQVLTYKVRVWDNVARTASPGDKGYAETSKTSTYTPGTVTAINTLVDTDTTGRPWPNLVWTRTAGIPDEWIVVRDGSIIARFPGINGMTYQDWTCPPNTDVVYKVFPVAAGVVGSSGISLAVRREVDGAWVLDPDTGDYYTITGHSQSITYAESSVVYEPVGGSSKVKRTWALRGLEGSMSGLLDEYAGRTVADQEADLLAIKGRADQEVRLVFGDQNIPVSMMNVSSVPSVEWADVDHIRKDVSFDFWQTDELPFPEVGP